ncbi:amidohydrolase family protein [Rhodopila sp.]|uniref:amidohydrolase family protein n=1 Tax=Rhodopila sp. TaxID=2480087 RepID=UPI002C1E3437|nr:amidohydrolase family protein [Rhodopila sp.]HVZ06716.1 amidohydrolase family protein [Rhodopila sp.]
MPDTILHARDASPATLRAPEVIIDSDVHPWVNGDIAGLKNYLSRSWWEHFDGRHVLPNQWLRPPLARASSNRIDALPPRGGEAGSDPHFMKEDHLDRHNIAHAVLSSIQAGKLAALPNAGEALALATAFNEYFANEFMTVDPRYKLAMVVAAHDPTASAKEIRSFGRQPGIVAVYMPLLNILMGNRHYYPIYEAAEEVGLPILIHPTGTEGGFPTAVAFAGGTPSTYIERHTAFPEVGISSINSLVFEGVFARFPKMMLLAAEFGFSWLPHFLWRMDQNWRQFRKEVPWVQTPPSETVLAHIRSTSQPIEEPEKSEYLDQILQMIHAERTLLFSTDYPHWDNDFPINTLTQLSPEWRQQIFYQNAADLFHLD